MKKSRPPLFKVCPACGGRFLMAMYPFHQCAADGMHRAAAIEERLRQAKEKAAT